MVIKELKKMDKTLSRETSQVFQKVKKKLLKDIEDMLIRASHSQTLKTSDVTKIELRRRVMHELGELDVKWATAAGTNDQQLEIRNPFELMGVAQIEDDDEAFEADGEDKDDVFWDADGDSYAERFPVY